MDPNKLTQKSQEALHAAQTKALRYGHQEVDGEHLFLALLEQPEGLVPRLLSKMGIPVEQLKTEVEDELQKRPRVSGPGTEAGKIYVTQRLNRLLMKAEEVANRLKDEYVSVEHLVLPLIDEGNATASGRILKSFNVTTEGFLQAGCSRNIKSAVFRLFNGQIGHLQGQYRARGGWQAPMTRGLGQRGTQFGCPGDKLNTLAALWATPTDRAT